MGLCYNPEFIALGSVVRDMLSPDMILIGQSDAKAGEFSNPSTTRRARTSRAIQRMSFVNAELTKIAVNTFVTTKISYANMLAGLCDRLPGADVDVVTRAIGCDSRIGTKPARRNRVRRALLSSRQRGLRGSWRDRSALAPSWLKPPTL